MSSGQMTVLVATVAAVVLVLVVLLVVLVQARRAGRRTEAALAASRAEIAALQARLDTLTAPPSAPASQASTPRQHRDEPEFVITTAGRSRTDDVDVSAPPPVDARQFASVALGESVVRLVSLGYGVRRALSAENRNRIAFEMRREVRRSRKDRRRELRDLRRKLREEPGPESTADRDAEENAA